MQEPLVARKQKILTFILALILTVGGLLRFCGIGWGFPLKFHVDENIIIRYVIPMTNENTLIAKGYHRPDHIIKKVSTVMYRLYAVVIDGKGWHDPLDMSVEAKYNVISRLYIAALGTLMIWVVWLILKQFSVISGLTGAALCAVFPNFVNHSHYVTSDIPITLMLLLCLYFILKYEKKQSYPYLYGAVLFAALGTLDKYPSVLTCGVIALSVFLFNGKQWRKVWRHLIFAVVSYVLTLFILSPNLFYDLQNVIPVIEFENRSSHYSMQILGWFGNMFFYCQQMLLAWDGKTIVFIILFFAALLIIAVKRDRRTVIFTALPLWWMLLSMHALHWERWGLPMYAVALLLPAYALGILYDDVKRFPRARIASIAATGVIILALLYQPLASSVAALAEFVCKDTRLIALSAAESCQMTARNTIYDPMSPFSASTSTTQTWTEGTVLADGQLYVRQFGVEYLIETNQRQRFEAMPDTYREELLEYQWLADNREPFIVYCGNMSNYKKSGIAIIDSARKLNAALVGDLVSGSNIAFFDISDLPVWLTVSASLFMDPAQAAATDETIPRDAVYIHELWMEKGTYSVFASGGDAADSLRFDVLPVGREIDTKALMEIEPGRRTIEITGDGRYHIVVYNASANPVAIENVQLAEILARSDECDAAD